MDRAFAAQRLRLPSALPGGLLLATGRALRRARVRRRLLFGMMLILLLALGWLWLRDSPLVSVQRVKVRGVHGVDAAGIRAALVSAARHESTLHVQLAPLRAAVAPYRVVRDLRVSTSFPHGMQITVIERLPVAALATAGERTAVAADGTILGPELASSSLPAISISSLPTRRVSDGRIRGQLAILGAAPAPLARRVAQIADGAAGIAVTLRAGPAILFGDASRPHAKWASAARVLADPGSAGASYIDVRLPDRPAAGGLSTQATDATPSTDPIAAALAAELGAAMSTPGSAAAGDAAAATPGAGVSSTPGATGAAAPGTTSTYTPPAATDTAAGAGAGAGPSASTTPGAATASGAGASPGTASPDYASGASGAAASSPSPGAGQPYTSTGG